jgi:cytochrome c oxidase subunit 2
MMQGTILLVSLLLMAAVGIVFTRTVMATGAAPAGAGAAKARTALLWAMIIFGVLVSLASLREWPHPEAGADPLVVNVSGGQWWWEIDTQEIPLGREVEFRITTVDVNHSMGIYSQDMTLLAQVQTMPGYNNKLVHTFDVPGIYRVLCMEFCGIAHHDMVNEFTVLEAKE